MNHREHYRIDAEEFDYFNDEYETEANRRRQEEVLHICTAKPGQSVLDIGSGNGWCALALAKRGCQVTAVDLSPKNLERIRRKNEAIRTFESDIYDMPLGEEQFDWIILNEVLEHLPEPKEALYVLKRFLRKRGKLLISVPYKEQIRYSLCIHCNQKTPHNAHLHSFDKRSLHMMLNELGYHVDDEQLYLSKILCLSGLIGFLRFLPFSLWRMKDQTMIRLFGKASYLTIVAKEKI